MNEQRNLYLAIGISIAIIIFFQILLPTQPIQPPINEKDEILEPAKSIDGQPVLKMNFGFSPNFLTRS